ncbi:MAG: nitrilase-related carbon-nitrogen hydrolase [Longimicrobiales bacterium]
MKVAGIQMDIAWEKPTENFPRARSMAGNAVDRGARLVVLPEMFATGFSMNAETVAGFAEDTRAFLSELARELSAFVLGGYGEPAGPRPANACSIFDPSGTEILHYRKIHPFSMAGEDVHYLAGDRIETAEVEGVRVTPLICYDLRFPEPFRVAATRTDLFCVVANWPEPRRRHWSLLLKARAVENQAFVLGVNRVGSGEDLAYTGDSALLDPMGDDVAAAVPGTEEVLLGEVDSGEVVRIRRKFGFLDDRQPALYTVLEDRT